MNIKPKSVKTFRIFHLVISHPRSLIYVSFFFSCVWCVLKNAFKVLFGGWGYGGLQRNSENKRPGAVSTVALDLETSHWWMPSMPEDRGDNKEEVIDHKHGHTATVVGDSLFLFGGWSGKQATNTLAQMVFQQI